MCNVETVQKIASCLNVPAGRIAFNEEKVITRTCSENQSVCGFATILTDLAKESPTEAARNSCTSCEMEAQVYQWVEFAMLHVVNGDKNKHVAQQVMRDLNKLFLSKSYLTGHFITLADLVVFYAIHDLMKSQSPIEKENYLNLSRWFDHMQQRPEIRQGGGDELLNFTTIYLHGWATGTHI